MKETDLRARINDTMSDVEVDGNAFVLVEKNIPSRLGGETIEERYMRVPDCDDDRRDASGYVNPRHEAARARVYDGEEWAPYGRWSPPIEADSSGRETSRNGGDFTRRRIAVVHAIFRRHTNGDYRISIIGGDDTSMCRNVSGHEKAMRLWSRVSRGMITQKTLKRLGFEME